MGAGRPVRHRTRGFDNDINALTRLRVALTTTPGIGKEESRQAIYYLDYLIDSLNGINTSMRRTG
jgi:ribosomal protein S13